MMKIMSRILEEELTRYIDAQVVSRSKLTNHRIDFVYGEIFW